MDEFEAVETIPEGQNVLHRMTINVEFGENATEVMLKIYILIRIRT